MATNNFINHENGIFTLARMTKEEVMEFLIEDGFEEHEITDQLINDRILMYEEFDCEEIFEEGCGLNYWLEEKGYTLVNNGNKYSSKVYNKSDKLVAELKLESGYYDGVQIIVETDPYILLDGYFDTQAELLEQYTPHHKRLLKAIAAYTVPIVKIGGFSDGSAVYELAK